MTGKTHRVGGMLCCIGGYTLLESKGLLIQDVSPLLQLVVMYPFAIYGSIVSDLDHHWNSTPSKDIVSFCINKLLHLTTPIRKGLEKAGVSKKSTKYKALGLFDAKHRSWQTHSDVFLIALIGLFIYFMNSSVLTANELIVKMVFTGLILGVISHLVLDMLTPEGIWCALTVILSRKGKSKVFSEKLHFVPNKEFFSTGGPWETLVRGIMWVLCFLLLARILYLMSPYRVDFLLN